MDYAGSVLHIYFCLLFFLGNSFPGGYEIEQRSTNHSAGTPLYQVAAEQLVLDGSDNLSDLTGNLTNLPGIVKGL